MAQDDYLVSEVNVSVVKSLLVQRAAVDDIHVVESRDGAPDLRVDMITTFLIWLSGDDHYLLQLYLVQVPRSQRHDEAFDR